MAAGVRIGYAPVSERHVCSKDERRLGIDPPPVSWRAGRAPRKESNTDMPDSEEFRPDDLLPFSPDTPLMEGMPVVAVDGEPLGTVGEDGADRFKVAAPL